MEKAINEKQPEMKEVGRIAHFFDKISVAVIEVESPLKAGDRIRIKGHATDFEQVIDSMQVEHEKIKEAKKGDSIGLKMKHPVKEHDIVYKLS